MSEVQARLRAALVAIDEENVDWLYRKTIEDAIWTLDDGIRPEEDAQGTVSGACAAVGRLDLLVEARALGYPWNAKTCVKAAKYGQLECLKYAHEQGCPWDKKTCSSAAWQGHLECLKYAHERGCPWDEETCDNAAKYGHLECLKYAHENGCPWDKRTCDNAAYYGHLECLKYAHENGCPWDEWTCRYAAMHGHLECLKYAHEHGCPWNEETCACAAYTGHLGCLKYGRMVHGVDVESHASTSGPTRSASARTHALRSRTGLPFSQCSATHAHLLSSTYASRCTPSIDSSPHAGLLTWIYAPGGVKKRVSHPRARSANASPRR